MKQKVSDYIAEYIAQWGIRDVFTVTGGGAMHMNDAFGHHKMLHCTYQHHEQACAMAAEAYARLGNKMAAVCVTTGPGATNAITGVLGAWMDSIPMLVFSGQARYATTVSASGLPLRSMGVQECNIVPVVKSLTKYAHMIVHPENIRYHLEKALYLAVNGRPGPVWLDIPLDVQGAVIETDDLKAYDPEENPEQKPREIKDIDENELKKPSLHVSLPVCGDAGELIRKLIKAAKKRGASRENPLFQGNAWRNQCLLWKQKYPVVVSGHYETVEDGCTNIYAFYEELSRAMKENQNLMVSVGTSRVAGSQAFRVKKGQRFITNPNTASMGFCLPGATGVCIASGKQPVVCVTGEGSLQMNIQELQTIRQNHLPIKLFVINNQGYHSIRQTQQSYFGEPLVGVGQESGDLSFPDLQKLIPAYGFPYRCIHSSEKLSDTIKEVLEMDGAAVCEVFVTRYQKTEPKTSSKKLPDGKMVSAPLEDMYPFLSREELEENMYIPLPEQK